MFKLCGQATCNVMSSISNVQVPRTVLSLLDSKQRAWTCGVAASCCRTTPEIDQLWNLFQRNVGTHVELLAFEDVSVGPTTLTGSRGDGGQKSTGPELLFEQRVNLGILLSFLEDPLDVVGLFRLSSGVFGGRGLACSGDGLGVLLRRKASVKSRQ